jgi:hypothetical protein
VGDYPLSDSLSSPIVTMNGPAANPIGPVNCCWGGVLGNTGTFTVTSLTATRMQGSLVATLQPQPATAATGPLDVNITFDIGRQ